MSADLDRAALVAGTMAAGASGRRSTYDRRDGTWTTHHGQQRTQTTQGQQQR